MNGDTVSDSIVWQADGIVQGNVQFSGLTGVYPTLPTYSPCTSESTTSSVSTTTVVNVGSTTSFTTTGSNSVTTASSSLSGSTTVSVSTTALPLNDSATTTVSESASTTTTAQNNGTSDSTVSGTTTANTGDSSTASSGAHLLKEQERVFKRLECNPSVVTGNSQPPKLNSMATTLERTTSSLLFIFLSLLLWMFLY